MLPSGSRQLWDTYLGLRTMWAGAAGGRRSRTWRKELALDWHTVKALDMQYMEAQLKRVGTPRSDGDRR